MKKILLIVAVSIISFSCFATNTLAEEDDFTSKKPMSEEELYKAMGYSKDISKIINKFEEKFETTIMLPNEIPFEVKNKFAKIDEQNNLDIRYKGKDTKDNFQFRVNPEVPGDIKNNYKLKDGKEVYVEIIKSGVTSPVIELVYRQEELEYILYLIRQRIID
ncbi:hypothetical protein [Oceanobacillus neutriphilus]|uniref:Uncharacterized protein n=1 Tax=Oceanobacillus neutriphilus TaxID=531815 RepID=A0ABQ2NR73_9BACI|nr:hypothetical protein [Oceanobacillus neutriphilus]GGP09737.1 hypothetical protein GCM10011346_15040 [Oceanobacillus neutriphilus]